MTTPNIRQLTDKKHFSESVIILLSLILFIVIGFSDSSLFCVTSKENARNYAINMESGTIVTQRIPDNINHLKEFSLSIGTYGRTNDGTIVIKLYEDDSLIEQWARNTDDLIDNAYTTYTLSHSLNKTPGHDYYLTIEDVYKGDNSVALWANEIGENTDLTCIYTTISRRQEVVVMTVLLIIMTEAISICFMLKESSNAEDKSKKIVNYVCAVICTILIGVALYNFVTEASEKYSIDSVTPVVYLIITATLAISAVCIFASNKKGFETPYAVYFALLFLIYILRAPEDAISGYLWAEDGMDLLQGAMYEGPSSLFKVVSGTHWFVPRLVGLISYWICLFFNNLTIFPPLLGLTCKAIAVGSISYFMSNRFGWLVKENAVRFLVCAVVIFTIPYYDSDTTTCDTSVPFVMLFAAFLIGLDTLCNKKVRNASVLETAVLSLTAISNAAAPLCAGVSVLSFIRWIMAEKKDNKLTKKSVILESIKPIIVCILTIIQFVGILTSNRSGVKIDLGNRLLVCLRSFIFTPYFDTYKSWSLFFIALAAFIALAYLAKISWKVILYSSCFSYLFIAYSSLTGETKDITHNLFPEPYVGGRYILVSFLIAGFILAIEVYYLWKHKFTLIRFVGLALFIVMISIATLTYTQITYGMEYADTYTDNVDVFDRNGSQYLLIHIGPWDPYMVKIPWNISDYTRMSEPLENYQASPVTPTPDNSMVTVTGWASTPTGNPFEKIFIQIDTSTYLAPVSTCTSPDLSGSGYSFCIFPGYINPNAINFIGITSDGSLYCWTANSNAASE